MGNFYSEYINNVEHERCEKIAQYIIDTKGTVRGAAKMFGISKSTVHKDITQKLKYKNITLYTEVSKILQINKQERHIRGGIATRDKYNHIKSIKNNTTP